jgi:hypothetical protein
VAVPTNGTGVVFHAHDGTATFVSHWEWRSDPNGSVRSIVSSRAVALMPDSLHRLPLGFLPGQSSPLSDMLRPFQRGEIGAVRVFPVFGSNRRPGWREVHRAKDEVRILTQFGHAQRGGFARLNGNSPDHAQRKTRVTIQEQARPASRNPYPERNPSQHEGFVTASDDGRANLHLFDEGAALRTARRLCRVIPGR